MAMRMLWLAMLCTDTYQLSNRRPADYCVLIENAAPVVAVSILSLTGVTYVVYQQFKRVSNLSESPLPSSSLGIYKVSGHSKTLTVCAVDEMQSKCLLLPLTVESHKSKENLTYAANPIVHTVQNERS